MKNRAPSYDLIGAVLSELAEGKPILLSDDADRENEGDLVYVASKITPEAIAFMMEHGKGLICMSITESRMRDLGLSLQVEHNESMFGTNFATPFDHISVRESGITAASRAFTIKEAAAFQVDSRQFVRPGFVVPVVSRAGGVLQRRGQTEGSSDLARLAGFEPHGVICEVMDLNGNMIRGNALEIYAKEHGIISCTVNDLVEYRKSFETSIRLVGEKKISAASVVREELSLLKSEWQGEWNDIEITLCVFHDDVDGIEHFALVIGDTVIGDREGASHVYRPESIPVRVHSECLTGDVFGSLRCDCGPQFDAALTFMLGKKKGILIYLQQEGRGIGLANKLRAYELQEQGMDTVEANVHLGLPADGRDYRVAAQMLKLMGVSSLSLLTNNPEKIEALEKFSIKVTERIPLVIEPHDENYAYMKTKKERMGHLVQLKNKSL